MTAPRLLTAERLREMLSCDPLTGHMHWRISISKRARGQAAGCESRGRWLIRIDGNNYFRSRLVWLHVHGVWPDAEIDHIDGDRLNDRLENLRDVSRTVNQQNIYRPSKSNKSAGARGVSQERPGKFFARIRHNGVSKRLGTYATPEEASAAYLRAKRELHEGATR
jgi:hypothetical protein